MNRRHLAVIALVIAVPLFTVGLVSPVPEYEPHLDIAVSNSVDDQEELNEDITKMEYQNLSTSAQQLFKKSNNNEHSSVSIPTDEAPNSWATLVSESTQSHRIYVHKGGQYHLTWITWSVPTPPLAAVMLRLGPLLGAIGLGTLAGVLILTTEKVE
ncbi:hypothetical protein [Halocatena salina]|uniref:Uncharacterized protein n=1 Tax=Halocatena salina TaxID=2934340 RepID=A0A8U0A4Z2_9EURY|nr:hypothetical protein [Halocatena salina]UPM44162.1 hypothetical protein MW046_14170 [Halocatena salina]